jgi:hypothetical protein
VIVGDDVVVEASRVVGRVVEHSLPHDRDGGRVVCHFNMKGVDPWHRWC